MTASGVPADVHERAVEAAAEAMMTYEGIIAEYPEEAAIWAKDAEAAVTAAAPVLAEPYRTEIERLTERAERAEVAVQRVREMLDNRHRCDDECDRLGCDVIDAGVGVVVYTATQIIAALDGTPDGDSDE